MPDFDPEFLSDVKALSDNGTLHRVLEMLEADCVAAWKNGGSPDARNDAWLDLQGINRLRGRLASLCDDERVRNFNYRNRRNS